MTRQTHQYIPVTNNFWLLAAILFEKRKHQSYISWEKTSLPFSGQTLDQLKRWEFGLKLNVFPTLATPASRWGPPFDPDSSVKKDTEHPIVHL